MKIESTIELFLSEIWSRKNLENLEKEAKKSTHICSFKKIASIWRENMHEYFFSYFRIIFVFLIFFFRGHYLFQDANSETVSFE